MPNRIEIPIEGDPSKLKAAVQEAALSVDKLQQSGEKLTESTSKNAAAADRFIESLKQEAIQLTAGDAALQKYKASKLGMAEAALKQTNALIDNIDKLKQHRAASEAGAGAHENLTASIFKGATAADLAMKVFDKLVDTYRQMKSETMEAQQVQARLEAVLNATGEAAGGKREIIERLANSMAKLTKFDDDQVRAAATQLATLNLSNSAFERSIKLGADLAATYGKDLTSATQQLGKALVEPELGITSLERAYGRFDKGIKEQIVNMVKMNEVGQAQVLLLDQIDKKVSGVAEGSYVGLQRSTIGVSKAWDDLLKAMGRQIFDEKAKEAGFLESSLRSTTEFIELKIPIWQKAAILLAKVANPKAGAAVEAGFSAGPQALAAAQAAQILDSNANVSENPLDVAREKGERAAANLAATAEKFRTANDKLAEELKIYKKNVADFNANPDTPEDKKIGQSQVDEMIQKITERTLGTQKASEADRILAQMQRDLAKSSAELAGGTDKATAAQIKLAETQALPVWKTFSESTKRDIEALSGQTEANQRLLQIQKEVTAAVDKHNEVTKRREEKEKALVDRYEYTNAQLKIEGQAIGLSNAQREIMLRQLATQKDLDGIIDPARRDRIQQLADEREALIANNEALEVNNQIVEAAGNKFGNLFKDLVSGSRSATDAMKAYFRSFFEDLAAGTAKRYFINLVTGQSGGYGAVLNAALGASGGGSGTSAGSVVSGLSTAYGAYKNGASLYTAAGTMFGGYSATAASTAAGASAAGPGAALEYGAAQGGGAASGSGAGAMGAWAAYAYLIYMGMKHNDRVFDQGYNSDRFNSSAKFVPGVGPVLQADRLLKGLGLNSRTASMLSGSSLAARYFGRGGGKDGGSWMAEFDPTGGVSNDRSPGWFGVGNNPQQQQSLADAVVAKAALYRKIVGEYGGQAQNLLLGAGTDQDPLGTAQSRVNAQANVNGRQVYSQMFDVGRGTEGIGAGVDLALNRALVAALGNSQLPKALQQVWEKYGNSIGTMDMAKFNEMFTALDAMKAALDDLDSFKSGGDAISKIVKAMQTGIDDSGSVALAAMREQIDQLGKVFEAAVGSSTLTDSLALANQLRDANAQYFQQSLQYVQQLAGGIRQLRGDAYGFAYSIGQSINATGGNVDLAALSGARLAGIRNEYTQIVSIGDKQNAIKDYVSVVDNWLQSATTKRVAGLQKELELVGQMGNIADRAKSTLQQIQMGGGNPLSAPGRYDLASGFTEQARVAYQQSTAANRAGNAAAYIDALNKQYALLGQTEQRPSERYQSEYNKIAEQLSELGNVGQDSAQRGLDLQQQIATETGAAAAQAMEYYQWAQAAYAENAATQIAAFQAQLDAATTSRDLQTYIAEMTARQLAVQEATLEAIKNLALTAGAQTGALAGSTGISPGVPLAAPSGGGGGGGGGSVWTQLRRELELS